MDALTLQRVMSDPIAFRQHLVIDTDGGPRPLAEVLDPWQARDFAALDSGWQAAAGQRVETPRLRGWLERSRGHSKTQDLAVMLAWLLIAARRPVSAVAAAADRDQAALLRNAIQRLTLANSWLAGLLDVQSYRIVNEHNGATLEILSADAPSSYGLTPDVVVCDEIVHWPRRDLWDSLLSSAAKRPNCLLLIASNCGWTGSWQHVLRQQVEQDSRWYVSSLPGPCASWIGPEQLAEQRRLLPASAFARLWLNEWVAVSGDAIGAGDLQAAVRLDGPETQPDPLSWYLLGADRGLSRDRTALVLLAIRPGERRIRVALVRSWRPDGADPEAEEQRVESEILNIHRRFQLVACRFDPFAFQTCAFRLRRAGVPMSPAPFSGHALNDMAQAFLTAFRDRLIVTYNEPRLLADLAGVNIAEANSGFGLKLMATRTEAGHCDTAMACATVLPAAVQIATRGRPGAPPRGHKLQVVGTTSGNRLPLHPDGSVNTVAAYQLQQRSRG